MNQRPAIRETKVTKRRSRKATPNPRAKPPSPWETVTGGRKCTTVAKMSR